MAKYYVRRNVPGISKDDFDAALLRAVACAYNYEGMTWQSSYWDRESGVIHCIWEAESVEQVYDHARRSRVPCDEVREVVEFRPSDILEVTPELSATL